MAKTVNAAFDYFLREKVRIDKDRSDVAKSSKSNLIEEIKKFPNDGKFPQLHPDISIDYGSFSRKTKIRPLDDIDLMIILDGQGSTWDEVGDHLVIRVNNNASQLLDLCHDFTNELNSIKVVNKFVAYLSGLTNYKKADVKRNMEAATLNLISYEWIYDIVPCFITKEDGLGKQFYVIPDGKGNWKATDPRIDKIRTQQVHNAQKVSVLDMVRLMKYWTKRPTMPTMKSYFLENLILDYYGANNDSVQWVDRELPSLFQYIYHNVMKALNDPKGYQGDINHLTDEERQKIKDRASADYYKSLEAIQFEIDNDMSRAIGKWREIFGDEFPMYF